MPECSERAILFGAHGGLVGVLTEPHAAVAGVRRAVVMSNVGVHHHVGPFRLYVELARCLAANGWYVLRFDLAGMGDSVPRTEAPDPAAHSERDLSDAIAWLAEQVGAEQFVLVGLCSGVDSTHAVAVHDTRVSGAVFIDGYTYPTFGFYLRHHMLRYLRLDRWVRFLRRTQRRRTAARADVAVPQTAVVFEREYPPLAQFRADVARMTTRGAQLLFIYTATVNQRYNARRQFYEMLGRGASRDGIVVDTRPKADHLFSNLEQRAALLESIAQWAATVPVASQPSG